MTTHGIKTFAPNIAQLKDPEGGYFAAICLDDLSKESLIASTTYSRKDFYKITLVSGRTSYYYNGPTLHVQPGEWYLVFTNGEAPYRWEPHDGKCSGFSCMFTEDFLPLHTHIRPMDWPVFNGSARSVIRLSTENTALFVDLFKKMLREQASTYSHKYELLFLYVLECIHGAMKLQPEPELRTLNAASQLTRSFKTMLAGQFPLAYPHQQLSLRTPQHFAEKLAVHTNYLNRALKKTTGKTTTQLITERLMQEAQALVMHSNWTISQISHSFGFEEPTHFTRAFRQYNGHSPSSLRTSLGKV